MQLGCPPVA